MNDNYKIIDVSFDYTTDGTDYIKYPLVESRTQPFTFDFKSFDNIFDTFTYPQVPKETLSKTKVPDGEYTAEYFGFTQFSKLSVVVGVCADYPHAYAHAHPDLWKICFRSGRLIYDSKDEISPHPIFWHEYGHVLAGPLAGHGKAYQQVMHDLNKDYIAGPTCDIMWQGVVVEPENVGFI